MENIAKMEVHKHPRHVMQKKKWPEYVLEFLMIFFAVFLGFLAENIREHGVEKERVVKQMNNMLNDLRADTSRFGRSVRSNVGMCKGLDSFRLEVDNAIAGIINPNKLYYYYWQFGRGWINPFANQAAMLQMQNSGTLRLIRNDSLVYQMGDYYERRLVYLEFQRGWLIKSSDELHETCKLFFDLHGFEELVSRDTIFTMIDPFRQNYFATILTRNPPLTLFSNDPKDFKRLHLDLTLYELRIRTFNSYMRYCHEAADRLMDRIKKEYRIAN